MPQSLAKVLVHLVFSTKSRERLVPRGLLPHLHAYLVGILANLKCPSLQTGGTPDHVHILFNLGRTVALSEVVEEVNRYSIARPKKKIMQEFMQYEWLVVR